MKGGLYIVILLGVLLSEIRSIENVIKKINRDESRDFLKNSAIKYKVGQYNIELNRKIYESTEDLNSEFINNKDAEEKEQDIFSSLERQNELQAIQGTANSDGSLHSATYKTVNHFICMTNEIADTRLILYGTKAWTFSKQDVNLTLTYPIAKDSGEDDFIITGFKVVLYIDSTQTRGYITNGGIFEDKINLTFINGNISTLLYKFWLYGTPKNSELNMAYYSCG